MSRQRSRLQWAENASGAGTNVGNFHLPSAEEKRIRTEQDVHEESPVSRFTMSYRVDRLVSFHALCAY